MSVPLKQIAAVIRSKNAGPGKLTLDIIFRSAAWFERAAASGAITPELIAGLYGRRPEDVEIALFPPASAIKITMPRRTLSGGVSVNDTLLHVLIEDLPFGGVGASGVGAYHGEIGFQTFSHRKGVFLQSRFNAANLLRPPFGRLTALLLKLLMRR